MKLARVWFAYGCVSSRCTQQVSWTTRRRAHLKEAHVDSAAFNVEGIHAAPTTEYEANG
jgi:hypothetical protein